MATFWVLINVAVGEALLEQFLHHLLVIAGGGAGEQVVAQAEIAQILGDHTVVTVGELLCADAFLVASTRIGVPCSSVPDTISTSLPFMRS